MDHDSPECNSEDRNSPDTAPQEATSIIDAYSYGFLQRRIRSACAAFMKRGVPFGLIIMDIDHFKGFNDLRGPDEGDKFLNRMISMLKSLMHKGELLSSYGGDSFALILRESDWGYCIKRAEAMRREFIERFHDDPLKLTLSIGGALFPYAAEHESQLMAEAHYALHISKKRGGDCVTLIPSSPPGIPPGTSRPSYVYPPGRPPVSSPGYEQQLPCMEILLPDDVGGDDY
jgi:diguanylate cyclase (GGDEF)-like protein